MQTARRRIAAAKLELERMRVGVGQAPSLIGVDRSPDQGAYRARLP